MGRVQNARLDAPHYGNIRDAGRGFFYREYQCAKDIAPENTRKEDDARGTKIVPSRTEYGLMVDFLRDNPWCSPEQYKWGLSGAQIRLMSADFTHLVDCGKGDAANTDRKVNAADSIVIKDASDLAGLAGFGIPVINKNKNKDG